MCACDSSSMQESSSIRIQMYFGFLNKQVVQNTRSLRRGTTGIWSPCCPVDSHSLWFPVSYLWLVPQAWGDCCWGPLQCVDIRTDETWQRNDGQPSLHIVLKHSHYPVSVKLLDPPFMSQLATSSGGKTSSGRSKGYTGLENVQFHFGKWAHHQKKSSNHQWRDQKLLR